MEALAPNLEVPEMDYYPYVDNSDQQRDTRRVRTPSILTITELVRPFLRPREPLAMSPLPVCKGAPTPAVKLRRMLGYGSDE